jgi:hypothetical protein
MSFAKFSDMLTRKHMEHSHLILEEIKQRLNQADERLIKIIKNVIDCYLEGEHENRQLHRLVYTSARKSTCTDGEVEKILKVSRENNSKLGITGILIYTKDRFLQVLEGEKEKVMTLYHKIERDERHGGSIMRFNEPVSKRYFTDWDMAGKMINEDRLKFHTAITKEKWNLYRSMMDGDLRSYKDEGMRVLKTFLLVG